MIMWLKRWEDLILDDDKKIIYDDNENQYKANADTNIKSISNV